jgi:hypothetical protein
MPDPEPVADAEPPVGPEPAEADSGGPTTIAPRTGSIWPGLTEAGLPTRVPRQGDDVLINEAFADSWEAEPTGPTPLTRAPFTPTYLGEPPRPRSAWSDDLSPLSLSRPPEPPEPREPPSPAEPPEPRHPPEPKEPPAPPTPEPVPSPFPSPTPVPVPPEPMPPAPTPPVPPGPPVPTPPPSPPVPTPPPPFPPPPGPVPPPPAIIPGAGALPPSIVVGQPVMTSVYQGGQYSEMTTEPITGVTTLAVPAAELASGTLTGHLLTRGAQLHRRRERRRRMRTVLWVTGGLVAFTIGIAVVVMILAGDFIRSVFDTLSRWAG